MVHARLVLDFSVSWRNFTEKRTTCAKNESFRNEAGSAIAPSFDVF